MTELTAIFRGLLSDYEERQSKCKKCQKPTQHRHCTEDSLGNVYHEECYESLKLGASERLANEVSCCGGGCGCGSAGRN